MFNFLKSKSKIDPASVPGKKVYRVKGSLKVEDKTVRDLEIQVLANNSAHAKKRAEHIITFKACKTFRIKQKN